MSVTMRIGDLDVGQAEAVAVDEERKHLRLDGLDIAANMFFSALVGPGDGDTPVAGEVTIRDDSGGATVRARGVRVFEYSSGSHEVVLAADELRR